MTIFWYNKYMLNNKKIIGLICECNPFHMGHKKIINEAKQYGDILIAVMSGNFVQRGEPAVFDKYHRTKQLIENGVDLIIELPIEFVLSSAKYFAIYSIKILSNLGFVDNIIFGSQINDLSILSQLAKINTDDTSNEVKSKLKKGLSYKEAILELYKNNTHYDIEKNNLSSNDILAIEYIRAINEINSSIKPISIKRDNTLLSATAIRKTIDKKITTNSFTNILKYKLLKYKSDNIKFSSIYGINNDLSNAISKLSICTLTFDEFINSLHKKNRTLANIKRGLFNFIFDINKNHIKNLMQNQNEYIKILGANNIGLSLLKHIKSPYITNFTKKSCIKFIEKFPNCQSITKMENEKNIFKFSESLNINIFASNLYNAICSNNILEESAPIITN